MPSVLAISGSYTADPSIGGSARPSVGGTIDEKLTVGEGIALDFELDADAPQTIAVATLPGFPNGASALIVRATGGKVKLTITTSDGASQVVPVDSFFAVICQNAPITSVSFTRPAGVTVQVNGALYAQES